MRIDTSVDFPAPLRPTSACASPGRTAMCALIRALVAPKLLETPWAATTGRPMPAAPGPAAVARECSMVSPVFPSASTC
ncbi:MAG: hypothetical protein AUG49_02520 [Catenulispora sp. 13_1_20CM_3_70_7]|nr:MAG: hypothetical protein AUG49_02520 [Catenulispora sp. 13_1_20CM_3_70_7]